MAAKKGGAKKAVKKQEKDVKKAYLGLAKKFHPDVNKDKGAAEKFASINNAYETLSDQQKRSVYD